MWVHFDYEGDQLATLIDGIMTQRLPWGLVILGAVLAVVMQLAGVSALAFAVGENCRISFCTSLSDLSL